MAQKWTSLRFAVLAVAILLAAMSVWALHAAVMSGSASTGLAASTTLISAIGLAAARPWSRFVVYALTAWFTVVWVYYSVMFVLAGSFQDRPFLMAALALVPGLGLLALSAGCSYVTFRYFKTVKPADLDGTRDA